MLNHQTTEHQEPELSDEPEEMIVEDLVEEDYLDSVEAHIELDTSHRKEEIIHGAELHPVGLKLKCMICEQIFGENTNNC